MMAGNKIVVPDYQRAYSWDSPIEDENRKNKDTQTDVFLSDLEEHKDSDTKSPFINEVASQQVISLPSSQTLTSPAASAATQTRQ